MPETRAESFPPPGSSDHGAHSLQVIQAVGSRVGSAGLLIAKGFGARAIVTAGSACTETAETLSARALRTKQQSKNHVVRDQ